MSRSVLALGVVGAALLLPSLAFAGAAEVVACRAIADDHERLACFDRTIGSLAKDIDAQTKSPTERFGLVGEKPKTEKEFGGEQVKAAKAPKPPKEPKEATESKEPKEPKAKEPPPVTNVSALITRIDFDGGKPVFHLDNGQVWAAQESRRVTLKGDGTDRAIVTKGMMSYFVTVNDSNVKISVVRVR